MAELVYLKNVVTLQIDRERCVGCSTCVTVCPHPVLALEDRKARIVNRDACMECGACATNCAAQAITVDPGVGCAAAVINSAVGRKRSACCAG